MKRIWIGLCVLALVAAGAGPAFAGGTVNKSNLSIEYFRILARNAATDHADIVAYNPAGTIKLEDGLYANLSAQYLIEKNYKNNFNDTVYGITEHESTEPSIVPGLYSVYKDGSWAAFFGANVPVGGGKVDYEKGNYSTYAIGKGLTAPFPFGAGGTLNSHSVEGESVGMGYTIGGAYRINDMFSFSLAGRYIDSKVEIDANANISGSLNPAFNGDNPIEFEATAQGWGWIAGLDIFPSDDLVIGIRYEARTKLDYQFDVDQGASILSNLTPDPINDGDKKRGDLPATFGTGVSYQINDKLRAEVNLTYYFNTQADIGGESLRNKVTDQTTGVVNELEDVINDGFEIGIGAEYALSKTLKLSAGYLYTESGVSPQYSSKFLPDLDSHTIGLGCQWTPVKNLDLNFGAGYVSYMSDSYTDNTLAPLEGPIVVEYQKHIPYLGFGLQYKFF